MWRRSRRIKLKFKLKQSHYIKLTTTTLKHKSIYPSMLVKVLDENKSSTGHQPINWKKLKGIAKENKKVCLRTRGKGKKEEN